MQPGFAERTGQRSGSHNRVDDPGLPLDGSAALRAGFALSGVVLLVGIAMGTFALRSRASVDTRVAAGAASSASSASTLPSATAHEPEPPKVDPAAPSAIAKSAPSAAATQVAHPPPPVPLTTDGKARPGRPSVPGIPGQKASAGATAGTPPPAERPGSLFDDPK